MCGISGILSSEKEQLAFYPLKKMLHTLAHRGPDGEGCWQNPAKDVLLGHRRLAVIDLSNAAAQPMHFENRYSIVHNGEIYNYKELRSFLQQQDYIFKSQSDTEVILAAYDFWKERCLQHFDGMFAFAIWDEKEKILFAARDRFGEKPFYYFEDESYFLFASEMKAIWAAGLKKEMNEKMLLNYLALGQVQNAADKEYTFYKNIWALPPAHYLLHTPALKKTVLKKYWHLDKESQLEITTDEAIEKFTALLAGSVKKRLRSDVAVGTSLSGGLDSAAVMALIKGATGSGNHLQKTFSAVFPGFEKDESAYIDLLTAKFKTENYKTAPKAEELICDFEKLCLHQEEPFASSSIFAQYKVFELAKQHNVTVLLDGQGADEILAGYHKYIHWFLQDLLKHNYAGERRKAIRELRQNNIPFHWGIKNHFAALLPMHTAMFLERKEYNHVLTQPDVNPDFLKQHLRGKEWEGIHKAPVTKLNDILHYDVTEFGLEELLRYADRNSMAHGLEVRLPFLDHSLVEFAFALPPTMKINEGYTKWLLRKAMDQKLPAEITWRKDKVGYEPPQKLWMENPVLQEYIQEAKRKLVDKGVLQSKVLNKKIIPKEAAAANNFDWRYLCAAQLY